MQGCLPCTSDRHARLLAMHGRPPCKAAHHARPTAMQGCLPCTSDRHARLLAMPIKPQYKASCHACQAAMQGWPPCLAGRTVGAVMGSGMSHATMRVRLPSLARRLAQVVALHGCHYCTCRD
eukprot:362848-Chlamydomonas_euryale.AAC.2